MPKHKEQILEELKKEFYLIFALDELKKIGFDIDKVWAWIEEQALSKSQQATISEIEKELKEGSWLVFLTKDIGSLASTERDIKIRKQMRKEIINYLDKLKKEG